MTRPAGVGPSDADEVELALDATVERLRHYVAMARGLAGEHPDPADVAHDPRLDDAQRSLGTAMGALCDAYVDTFGHVPTIAPTWPEEVDGGPEGDTEDPNTVEVFGLRLLVGLDPDAPPPRAPATPVGEGQAPVDGGLGEDPDDPYGAAFRIVDDAGFALTEALEEAGYLVPSFVSSRGSGFDDDLAEDPVAEEGDEA